MQDLPERSGEELFMGKMARRSFVTTAGALAGSAALYQLLGTVGARAYAAATDGSLPFSSAVELAGMLRDKRVGSEELTRLYIERIERYDRKLNAIPVRQFDVALEAARAADSALARGRDLGPLHGLPMTIKESYDIAGLPTTWGVPDWKDNVAARDSETVRRLKGAGAHFMGKTNVPLRLGDFQSYNEIYGTTNNPWDTDRVPGGSSGGSAAALAAGLTGLDSGSDIAGSIRNPAHYCGVYGHKPTWGIVPPQGHAPLGVVSTPDLAVVGPLGRSAADLKLAMSIVAGADPLNAPGWRLELPPPRMQSLSGLRVAVLPDHGVAPVDREIADRVAQVADVVSRKGGKTSDTARPEFVSGEGFGVYVKLLRAITGGPDDNIDHQQWLGLDNQRTYYRMGWQAFFQDWDVLVCPIMSTTAIAHDHSQPRENRTIMVNGEPQSYMNQVFWAGIATLSYLPSTVFPTGLSRDGLPIGLQVIGAEFDDQTTMAFARLLADEMGGFVAPPGYA
ncbi:MAG: amidase family protein [Gammaproteobacteria bacterium]